MTSLLTAHPIAVGREADHVRWCEELKERRADFGASRDRVGIRRQVVWVHDASNLAVLRVDGADPPASLRALAASDDPFDTWYARREREIHGGSPLEVGDPAVCLTAYVDGEPDDLDMFIGVAVPLLPGQTEPFRRSVASAVESGDGQERLRMWRMKRLAIWVQSLHAGDVVIYDAVGDLAELMDSLASSDHPQVEGQRRMIKEWFGIDLATANWPIPRAALAWSSPAARQP